MEKTRRLAATLTLAAFATAIIGGAATAKSETFGIGSCDATGANASTYAKTSRAASEYASCDYLRVRLYLATQTGGHPYSGALLTSPLKAAEIRATRPTGSYVTGSQHQARNTLPNPKWATLELDY